jgi:pimeloyl-ACP methyl ester carboxylesterase
MINDLTNPPNDSVPAFHVVAPSIPSYGFSPAPVKPGFGPIEAGHAFNELMLQLNYTRYVIQGGDLGGYILRYQASSHPETVVSVLCNFWIEPPNQTDIARHAQNQTRAEENSWFDFLNTLATKGFMHLYTQKTAPLQAGFAMTDSPIGFTMWIYQVMAGLAPTPYSWRLDEIITWSMMYLIQGPYSAMRFYKEFAAEGAFVGATSFGELPYVHVPVGVIKGGLDVGYYVPLDWAQRRGNITAWYVHDEGVHLAAYQTPESLLSDIWKFFGDPATSGTKEFHTE